MARPRTSTTSMIEPLEGRQLLAASIAGERVVTQSRSATSDASTSSRRVIGYLPEYRISSLNKIDFTSLTHINYFSISATTTGALTTGNVTLSNLAAARNKAHAAGVTISITVGPQTFSTMSSTTASLNTFVTNIIQYVQNNDLDGIDIDWEPPASNTTDKARYGALIDALYAQAHPLGLLLSAAVNPITTEIPVAQANKLDWINIMGYDFDPANHSPYTSSVNSLVRWSNYGVAKDKLILGVPFYGRSGTTWSNTVSRTYSALVGDYFTANGVYPPASVDTFNGYYFNGANTIAAKSQYVLDNNYGGVMIWELGQDYWYINGATTAQSLLPVIKSVIQPTQTVASVINTAVASPTSGSTAYATEAKSVVVNVTANIKSAGVMQVELLRPDGTLASQDFHVVSAATPTYAHAFVVSVTEPSAGTRTYTVNVRFRSGVTAGPLAAPAANDVVMTSSYIVVWQPVRDIIAPTVTDKSFLFETGRTVRFAFSENVASTIAATDLVIRRTGDATSTTATNVAYDEATNTATFTLAAALADGDYTATIPAGSVSDAGGNAIVGDQTLALFLLTGDLNRDRTVDFADLVTLSQNYGLSGKTYSQGNIDYSPGGTVDFGDLVLLAQRYNVTLASAITAPPPALLAAPGSKSRRVAGDVLL